VVGIGTRARRRTSVIPFTMPAFPLSSTNSNVASKWDTDLIHTTVRVHDKTPQPCPIEHGRSFTVIVCSRLATKDRRQLIVNGMSSANSFLGVSSVSVQIQDPLELSYDKYKETQPLNRSLHNGSSSISFQARSTPSDLQSQPSIRTEPSVSPTQILGKRPKRTFTEDEPVAKKPEN
jgi:hypothetical protein